MSFEPKPDPITITVQEAERISGLGHTLISQAIASGEIETTRVRGRRLVIYASFMSWLMARRAEPPRRGPAPKPQPEVLPVPPSLDELVKALEEIHGVVLREDSNGFDFHLVAGKGPLLGALRRRRAARR
jgi:hypothetical protein